MRQFQDLGHQVIFLIGDFTAMIGDPSGRNATRPPLTARGDRGQRRDLRRPGLQGARPRHAPRCATTPSGATRCGARGMIQLAAQHTVARMLERDDFTKRYAAQQPIAIHEFLYPLMQGYDSVALKADVELGGTDQKFNLLVGRDLQEAVRPGAAVHPDHAAAGRPRRRREDVQVARQLHRHQRAGERHVRQDDDDRRRADVALVRAAQLRDRRRRSAAR